MYLHVLTELTRIGITNVNSPERFVRKVARAGFRWAHWRESAQAAKHTPAQEDSILESGVAIDLLGHPTPPSLLDELIEQEDRRIAARMTSELSVSDQQLLTTRSDAPRGLLRELARQIGCNVRTLQRRRNLLRERLRREWQAHERRLNAGATQESADSLTLCRTPSPSLEQGAA